MARNKRENLSSFRHPLTLYLASGNPGKVREFWQAATARGIVVEALPRFSELPACVEDGVTFEENACKKALHFSRSTQGLVFSDDSGLSVDALGGAPGVHSARYSGPEATDASNNAKLLRELERAGARNRSAHYVCIIALARKGNLLGTFEGRADGLILEAPRGSGGFGYDPYFLFPPFGKTFAEVTAEQKFSVSHRGEAFRRLLEFLSSAASHNPA
jgi:XTP/dITP diphosphohydrolase